MLLIVLFVMAVLLIGSAFVDLANGRGQDNYWELVGTGIQVCSGLVLIVAAVA